MISVFSSDSANDIWAQATRQLLDVKIANIASRGGDTREILHVVLSLSNPRERWVTQRFPPISIAFALAELMWILSGSNDARILNYWNPKLPQYAGNNNSYHGAYGFRIRNSFGLDQLERAYFALKSNPETRQVVISIWDPKLDFPGINGEPVDKDIPCNICSLLKIRDEKLEWTQIMRSNDVFLGLPYNFIQFTSLQEILAGWLNIEVGSYTHFSDSLHLYENNFDILSMNNNTEIINSDNLSISKTKFDLNTNQIFDNMISISRNNLSENELLNLAELDTGDKAYQNIMLIISAYAAYKLNYLETEKEILSKCSNELFVHMWKQWKVSKEGGKSR